MSEEISLNEATFNPKVKTYIFFVVLFFLITSIIGIINPFETLTREANVFNVSTAIKGIPKA